MSRARLRSDAVRWLAQARDDLQAAEALGAAMKFAQACFFCHQAAEKAVKALGYLLDLDPWGHSLLALVRELPEEVRREFEPLHDDLVGLDKLYIPTRYPDSLGELTPAEAFTRGESEQAISRARLIVEVASRHLGEASS